MRDISTHIYDIHLYDIYIHIIYLYIYIYIYTYTYIYIYTHTHTHTCTYTYAHKTCPHTHTHDRDTDETPRVAGPTAGGPRACYPNTAPTRHPHTAPVAHTVPPTASSCLCRTPPRVLAGGALRRRIIASARATLRLQQHERHLHHTSMRDTYITRA